MLGITDKSRSEQFSIFPNWSVKSQKNWCNNWTWEISSYQWVPRKISPCQFLWGSFANCPRKNFHEKWGLLAEWLYILPEVGTPFGNCLRDFLKKCHKSIVAIPKGKNLNSSHNTCAIALEEKFSKDIKINLVL